MTAELVKICFILSFILAATTSIADNNEESSNIKQLQGISIVGNREAPRALYIIPWHNSKLEQSILLSPAFMNNNMQALDRASFLQQLKLYKLDKSSGYNTSQ